MTNTEVWDMVHTASKAAFADVGGAKGWQRLSMIQQIEVVTRRTFLALAKYAETPNASIDAGTILAVHSRITIEVCAL